jgi:ketosteroid isomerase-like protein
MPTTQEAQNTQVVQNAYAAFARGDVQAILDSLADDIDWNPVYGAGPHVPMAGHRTGKDAVRGFFKLVADHMHFSTFEPREFIAQGDNVVTLGHYIGKSGTTGKSFASDFAMVFTLRHGTIVRFQEFTDSAQLDAAYQK